MKHHLTLIALAAMLLTAPQRVAAQVFIPDTLVRTWLNADIPGIVDANGIMDTSHVGIATLDSVRWEWFAPAPGNTAPFDLTGLQYLDSVTVVSIAMQAWGNYEVSAVIPALPPSAEELYVGMLSTPTLSLPILKSPLKKVFVGSAEFHPPLALSIQGIEDTLDFMSLGNVGPLDAGISTGHIRGLDLILRGPAGDTLELPNWSCGELRMLVQNFDPILNYLDLGSMSCDTFQLMWGPYDVLSWPNAVTRMQVEVSAYTDPIPSWPPTVRELDLHLFGQNRCVPMLPNELRRLWVTHMGNPICIPNIPDSLEYAAGDFMQIGDTSVCSVLNSDCPGPRAALAGRLFLDADADGTLDAGEAPMPMSYVLIQPSNAMIPADNSGWWEHGVLPGTYTMTPGTNLPYLAMAPSQHDATFAALGEVDSTNHFGYTLIPNVNDLRVHLFASAARPGFNNLLYLTCRNEGTTVLSAHLSFTFDSDQTWLSSTPPPTTQTNNTATWDLPGLPVGAQVRIPVILHTDAAIPIGTLLLHQAVVDPSIGDTTPANNMMTSTSPVVGSYDPNDKLLDKSTATLSEVQAGDLDLIYTIRFQNTGTYQAERVVIVDTLSDQLQWSTFQFLSSSHSCDWYMVDGVLHFIFDPIMLPDSGSDEIGSHGFVSFSMRPSTQLHLGETVSNVAHIVFDFNEPIVTPPAVFLVDNLTAVGAHSTSDLIVMPNPTRDRLRIDGFTGTARYVIRDIGGRIAQNGALNGPGTIEVARLSPGTYFLEVEQDAATRTVRFVRER